MFLKNKSSSNVKKFIDLRLFLNHKKPRLTTEIPPNCINVDLIHTMTQRPKAATAISLYSSCLLHHSSETLKPQILYFAIYTPYPLYTTYDIVTFYSFLTALYFQKPLASELILNHNEPLPNGMRLFNTIILSLLSLSLISY